MQTCPLRGLKAVHMEDAEFEKLAAEKGLVPIVPASVGPRVWYKNLHRFTDNMIAGEIAYMEDKDTEACAAAIEVLLKKDGEVVARESTSTFGEFCFDPVPPNSGEYEVCAELPGRGNVSVKFTMGEESVDVGLLRPGMEPKPSHHDWKPARD